ncbi:Na/Pi cotransporter family protein [bacterium]|nr:Na/Pi cotransporter family protein [bacterium]
MYGMKVLSNGMQQVAGRRLRSILGALASNRYRALLTGVIVTGFIQTSSAVTVLVVSFVNAGMLHLLEAIYLIMGANIGTTVTAWLVVFFGMGEFSIGAIVLPLVALGFSFFFFKGNKYKAVGESVIGFALLFLGLGLLRDALPVLDESSEFKEYLGSLVVSGGGYVEQVLLAGLFVVIGFLFTAVIQSSSVATAFTIVLTYEGWIPLPLALALVLGENIGTTVTANIAALVANVHAKRAARAHLLFNAFGVLLALPFLPWYTPAVRAMGQTIAHALHGTDVTEALFFTYALSFFHSAFNIANTLVFLVLNLSPRLERLLLLWMPSRASEDEEFHLEFIEGRLTNTSELSIVEVRRELALFARQIEKAYKLLPRILLEPDETVQEEYLEKIERIEHITDKMELDIANYLAKASRQEISIEASQQIRNMLSAGNHLERTADLILKVGIYMVRRKQEKAFFTPELRRYLLEFMEVVGGSIQQMIANVAGDAHRLDLIATRNIERSINRQFSELRKDYLKAMEQNKYKVSSGLYYHDLLSELERIGDHVERVSEALFDNR